MKIKIASEEYKGFPHTLRFRNPYDGYQFRDLKIDTTP